MTRSKDRNSLLRELPSVDALLKTDTARGLANELGPTRVTSLARLATEDIRQSLLNSRQSLPDGNGDDAIRSELLKQAEQRLIELHRIDEASGVRRVINATGVVLHTNLGRAPLSDAARRAIDQASGYCTLEYDAIAGSRGRRGARAEDLLRELTGAGAALIVNNCAAAAFLVLNTFARDGEAVISRGELVEIGGDFRVPDIMAQSGARMIEVGTTNRTRLSDYRGAINERSRLVMRVHTSNYRIVGFTKVPSLSELAGLTRDAGLPLYEDAGSGALIDFTKYGIEGEPVIRESIEAGADIVSFSGDKLVGGPQTGLVVGRTELIERMRSNPLYRALRADKLRLAALEATLSAYSREEKVPTLEMIAMTSEQIEKRAKKLIRKVYKNTADTLKLEPIKGESAVGGGSAPISSLPTLAISVTRDGFAAKRIAEHLRQWNPPIIVRIANDRVLIDLRTVAVTDETEVEQALIRLGS
jgi:L-seryl-tRNA(Ser) seleniumtransferase